MIKSRPSNDILHTEVILEKITEYDIFRHYCFSFKILNKKFCSELRKDKRPSVSIVNYKGSLLYKDFGLLCGYANINMLLDPTPISEYDVNHMIRHINIDTFSFEEETPKREWVNF